MLKEDIYQKLNEIFQTVFDDNTFIINEAIFADDIENWDSLGLIKLIVAIEKNLGLKFDLREAVKMKNIKEMVNIIYEKLSIY